LAIVHSDLNTDKYSHDLNSQKMALNTGPFMSGTDTGSRRNYSSQIVMKLSPSTITGVFIGFQGVAQVLLTRGSAMK
jgi:hypothetical protein